MSYIVYMLRCSDDTLYTGITNNLERRINQHNSGTGAKYTRGRCPVYLVYTEECTNQSMALKREIALKKLSRQKKEELITKAKSKI
ncbi:MAG: GIY-YIG nuclease family protein [Clostridiales bacterium]